MVSGGRYFNPRPRKEGDSDKKTVVGTLKISIHALVKRATGEYDKKLMAVEISIHALVKRATLH